MTPWILLTAAALVALLYADRTANANVAFVAKPAASAGFIAAALALGALDSTYGQVLLGGLVLSAVGDVCLLGRSRPAFLSGLGAFLAAHLVYIYAFWTRGVTTDTAMAGALVLTGVGIPIARWLLPKVETGLRAPVIGYMVAITVMVAFAFGTLDTPGGWVVLLGAAAFYGSDISVAVDRFAGGSFGNRLWGLPLYYAAQLILASTIATAGTTSVAACCANGCSLDDTAAAAAIVGDPAGVLRPSAPPAEAADANGNTEDGSN